MVSLLRYLHAELGLNTLNWGTVHAEGWSYRALEFILSNATSRFGWVQAPELILFYVYSPQLEITSWLVD